MYGKLNFVLSPQVTRTWGVSGERTEATATWDQRCTGGLTLAPTDTNSPTNSSKATQKIKPISKSHERYDAFFPFFLLSFLCWIPNMLGNLGYRWIQLTFYEIKYNDLQNLWICMCPLGHCIRGIVSFNVIPNMPIFVYLCFSIKISNNNKRNLVRTVLKTCAVLRNKFIFWSSQYIIIKTVYVALKTFSTT